MLECFLEVACGEAAVEAAMADVKMVGNIAREPARKLQLQPKSYKMFFKKDHSWFI